MCEYEHVREAVLRGIQQFYADHGLLLEIDANERSVTHWLANCLQPEFPQWDIDCEYNRKGELPKELKASAETVAVQDTDARTVFPDIIVHRRKRPENILIAEIKKAGSRVGPEKDLAKLVDFGHEGDYAYKFGIFAVLGIGQFLMQWFAAGEPTHRELLSIRDGQLAVQQTPHRALADMSSRVEEVLERMGFDA